MISDEDIKYFASVHAGGAIGEMATELLQLREDKTDIEYIRADIHDAEIDVLKADLAASIAVREEMQLGGNRMAESLRFARAETDALKAENANLEFLLQHVIGDHCAPNDCYATGPLTGNPIADLVSCPSCAALDYLASKEGHR